MPAKVKGSILVSEAGVPGGQDLPDMGARNYTWVFGKSSRH